MYNIRLQAPKLARKCEIKHWYACADGRKVGWSVYGHVIAEFSRMDRFSKLYGFELSTYYTLVIDLVIDLIGQLRRDVIGRLSVKP